MKSHPLPQILATLKRIEAALWVENPNERIRHLERRLEVDEGNWKLLDKKITALEKYFEIQFVKDWDKYRSL